MNDENIVVKSDVILSVPIGGFSIVTKEYLNKFGIEKTGGYHEYKLTPRRSKYLVTVIYEEPFCNTAKETVLLEDTNSIILGDMSLAVKGKGWNNFLRETRLGVKIPKKYGRYFSTGGIEHAPVNIEIRRVYSDKIYRSNQRS